MISFRHNPDPNSGPRESGAWRELQDTFSLRRWLRLNLLLLAMAAIFSVSFPVIGLNHRVGDSYFRMRGTQPASRNVAMVLIDDSSLSQYGRWPWPRRRLAQLVQAVHRFHPRAIGIDILLPEAEDELDDMALETAIREAGNVVLPAKISDSLQGGLWKEPLPRFAKVAAAIGHAQAALDSDGVCRRIPLTEPSLDGLRTAFAVALANLARNGDSHASSSAGAPIAPPATPPSADASGVEHLASGEYLTINYRDQFVPGENAAPFVAFSATDLLQGDKGQSLEGKTVLIGFGATELSDRLFTPVSNQIPMPGVEVNANAVDTLLDAKEIRGVGILMQFLLLAGFGMLSLWLVMRWMDARGLLYLGFLLLCAYAAGFVAFSRFNRELEYGIFLVAGVIAAPLAQLENLVVVDRAISRRLKALERLLPAATDHSPGKIVIPARRSSAPRLHWKLRALQGLEDELASLYTFDETLLEAMQEALAVYAFDGRLLFHNSSWKIFAEEHEINPTDGLEQFTRILELGLDPALASMRTGVWIDKQVAIKDELWRFRLLRLPWPSAAEPEAVMLLAEDITAQRQRDQARAEALGFVTHELRTPLIAIQGFAELLVRYPQQAAGGDAAATIFRESRRLVAMINAYLEVLRMDVGSRPIQLKPILVRDMVQHVEQILQPLAESARIQIQTQVMPETQVLNCDEALVTGALLNLVSNAVKYSSRESTVTLQAVACDEEVEFQVRNPGPPIPAEDLERLFEPYYRLQVHSTTPGWGLGLAFVKRISEQHHGRVKATSDAVSGTCFYLAFPIGSTVASEAVV